MSSKFTRISLLLALAASASTLTACAGSNDIDEIRDDLTPGMRGLTTRDSDKANNIAITRNINRRQLWDDLGRIGLLDRPSRLTPVPMAR